MHAGVASARTYYIIMYPRPLKPHPPLLRSRRVAPDALTLDAKSLQCLLARPPGSSSKRRSNLSLRQGHPCPACSGWYKTTRSTSQFPARSAEVWCQPHNIVDQLVLHTSPLRHAPNCCLRSVIRIANLPVRAFVFADRHEMKTPPRCPPHCPPACLSHLGSCAAWCQRPRRYARLVCFAPRGVLPSPVTVAHPALLRPQSRSSSSDAPLRRCTCTRLASSSRRWAQCKEVLNKPLAPRRREAVTGHHRRSFHLLCLAARCS
eukprot:SAG11_NODE_138_length_15111_cov_11.388289_18_plen_262_part_00